MKFSIASSSAARGSSSVFQVGADIVRKALVYPLKLIASNSGVNGSVVVNKVMEQKDPNVGYNAATDKYEDLFAAGIIDPTKVGFPHTLLLPSAFSMQEDCNVVGSRP